MRGLGVRVRVRGTVRVLARGYTFAIDENIPGFNVAVEEPSLVYGG